MRNILKSYLMIAELIEVLEKDREFKLQLAAEKYIHPVKPQYMKLDLHEKIRESLKQRGITLFYSHQVKAIDLIRQGKNIILMTPTASGKSLVYNIPVIESMLEHPDTTAIYVFPLKGLEQDQVNNFNDMADSLGFINAGMVYDGDTPARQRKMIRQQLPNVIFTNPDMLHLALLPFHRKWEDFFRRLRFVVIDEIHAYRGVFGSNVAHIIRRLRRICDHYGSRPQFVAASATIANPEDLAKRLTGLDFRAVTESGAPSAGKHFYFVEPVESPYTIATKIFVRCLEMGIRTIVFTKSRRITELIYSWSLGYAPHLRDMISPYRAGFLPKERRQIEARLFSGELLGVVSTSALELGVDIGGLDCCILCGYPGSVSSTWQRAGRVGRHGQESVVILISGQDALDHYFMHHPEEFFEKSHEAVVIDPENKNILKKHIICAAAELFLKEQDSIYDFSEKKYLIDELANEKKLIEGKRPGIWFSTDRRPHKDVGIRSIGERFMIVSESGRLIGELSGFRTFREAFPGAVYLHRGRQYLVTELDINKKRAVCKEASLNYYTQALSAEATEIIKETDRKKIDNFTVSYGILRITQRITGYDKKRVHDGVRIATHLLDMPEFIFETEGLWTIINREMMRNIEENGFDLAGTLHAVEHASIACMPLFALCDRGDIGGLSHTCFPDFNLPAIFIYDGHEGGVGLSKRAVEIVDQWLKATLKILRECPCSSGCPSCVQDPQCGNRNQPLDKHGAIFLLNMWL